MTEPILVADIGGTNARFAIAELEGESIFIRDSVSLKAEDFEHVRDAAEAYMESVKQYPARACLAVAAPVDRDEVSFTNSHWTLQKREFEEALKFSDFRVINDFYAAAAGVAHLNADSFVSIKVAPGDPAAPKLVIGPGTGLGQALIIPTRSGPEVIATEGGHVTFAPRTEEEFAVMAFIAREHPRVSAERLLSGRGLVNIYRALCTLEHVSPALLKASEITAAANSGDDPIALRTVNMFCDVLGSEVGDAVLATGARGGVILGGGILPKIREIFMNSGFVNRFLEKGRMQAYVDGVPVRLIVDDRVALFGAAATITAQRG